MTKTTAHPGRRAVLGLTLGATAAALAGCAADAAGTAAPPAAGQPQRWRMLQGGFLVPALPGPGLPAAGTGGMFTRFVSPSALALRGNDLLVADRGSGRLWWADLAGPNMTGVAGVPVSTDTQLLLGADLTAWVLDPAARRVLRYARDGRLIQTASIGTALPTPTGFGLADAGATVLVAGGAAGEWAELRGGNLLRTIAPRLEGDARVSGIDAFAAAPDGLYALDRLAGVVHVVDREGRVLRTLGRGDLRQPVALASDAAGRAYVLDAQDNAIRRLRRDGAPAWRWSAPDLGLQRIGGLAVDGWLMAVSDPLSGQVGVFSFAHDREP